MVLRVPMTRKVVALFTFSIFGFFIVFAQSQQPEFCERGSKECENSKPLLRPNILLLLADDLGYGDLASYGNPSQEPGPIDRMAYEGVRFTQFYSADSMCSPSRAGLMTGRLPIRSGIVGGRRVFVDFDTGGLPREEITIAEALRKNGYATGFVGKWHLGINAKNDSDGFHLPSAHGFDFVGHNLPLTNLWECDEERTLMKDGPDISKCYVYNGDSIVQQPIAHATLTKRFLDDFRRFLDTRQTDAIDRPFFFYFSFHQVHTSLETAPQFVGTSRRGPFGDNVQELQYAVGEILTSLRERGIHEKTLVLFQSDHGPHRELCTFGGSTGGLRGGKGNSFEGGIRVPAIAYWPSVIPGGEISDAVLSSMDLLPTFLALAGGEKIDDRLLDGLDAHAALLHLEDDGFSTKKKLGKRTLFFYCNEKLAAVRHKNLKFHLLTSTEIIRENSERHCEEGGRPKKDGYTAQLCLDGDVRKHDPPLVFDLHTDPYEMHPLGVGKFNETWRKVQILIQKHRKSIVSVPNQLGKYNPRVIPCCKKPKCECNYP